METTGTLAGIFEFKQRVRAAGSDGKFKLQGGEGALEGQDSSQPVFVGGLTSFSRLCRLPVCVRRHGLAAVRSVSLLGRRRPT